jgi:hypothetical protein
MSPASAGVQGAVCLFDRSEQVVWTAEGAFFSLLKASRRVEAQVLCAGQKVLQLEQGGCE